MDMFCFSGNGCGTVNFTPRVDEAEGIKEVATFVALISPSVVILADWTCAFDKSVCEKFVVGIAIGLLVGFLNEQIVFVKLQEDVLGYLSMLSSRCAAEDVECNFEPVVNFGMNLVIFFT